MITGKLLYDKLKKLESELRLLKTAHIKTATTISTTSRTIGVEFSLTLDLLSGSVYGTKNAILEATTVDGSDMVCSCYVDNLTPGLMDNRRISVDTLAPKPGKRGFRIAVIAGNAQDWQTLAGGGEVSINYTIRVVGTSEFNLSVKYNDIDEGSE